MVARGFFFSSCFLSALLLCAGCGDDGSDPDDAGPPVGLDAGPPPGVDAGPGPGVDAGPRGDAGEGGGDGGGRDAGREGMTDGGGMDGGGGGAGSLGSACGGDGDCDGDLTCFTMIGTGMFGVTLPGGYCSKSCMPALVPGGMDTCGPDGSCVGAGVGGISGGYCAKLCDGPGDCRTTEGYECASPPFIGGPMACVPMAGSIGLPDASLPDGFLPRP